MDDPALPLLLVDIDGVISLFGFAHDRRPPGTFIAVDGLLHYLSATAGGLLSRLSERFELVWCSGWEERANEHLPSLLGLTGGLRHLSFEHRPARTAHWKLHAIQTFTGPMRPVAWIDDAHDAGTEAWARERPGPALIVRTDPAVGLTDAHVQALLAWAETLPGFSDAARSRARRSPRGDRPR